MCVKFLTFSESSCFHSVIVTETLTKTIIDLLNVMKSRATTMPPVMLGEDEIYIILLSDHISCSRNDTLDEATIIGEQNNVAHAFVLQKLPVYNTWKI